MAKAKKKKQFRKFESSKVLDDYKEPYITLTESLLLNDKWLNLQYSSKLIYIYMKKWSYGRDKFEFSYTLALNIVNSRSTIKKAIDELVSNGFIEIIKISKLPGIGTQYQFSDKWYINDN